MAFKTRKSVEIQTNILNWFHDAYGEDASLSHFINLLMGAAKDIHMKGAPTPVEIASQAAPSALEQMREE